MSIPSFGEFSGRRTVLCSISQLESDLLACGGLGPGGPREPWMAGSGVEYVCPGGSGLSAGSWGPAHRPRASGHDVGAPASWPLAAGACLWDRFPS